MAPGTRPKWNRCLSFSLNHNGPCSIRYPKTAALTFDRPRQPIELGKSEWIRSGNDGAIIAFGAMLQQALDAAEKLKLEGLEVAVINARFCQAA